MERNRDCPHGDKCAYSHSNEEQKKYLIPKPCIYVDANGRCCYPNCRFDHSLSKPTQPVQRENKLCRFVQPDGKCKYGETCKFLHTLPQTQQQSTLIVDLSDAEDDEDDPSSVAEVDPELEEMRQTVQRCVETLQVKPVKRRRVLTLSVNLPEDADTKQLLVKLKDLLDSNEGHLNLLHDTLVLA
jgi:hypothetical protein